MTRKSITRLKANLAGYQVYLAKYLQQTGQRIARFDARKTENTRLLDEHIAEPEIQENLFKTRRRISKAMAIAAKPKANGKSLRQVTGSQGQEKSNKQELSPEQKEQLFADLRTNFEANRSLCPAYQKWEYVQEKLEKSSAATLVTLNKMQARGGEPTVTAFDKNTGKYRFDDCSKESPQGGRNTTYLQAEKMAQDMGADLMEPEHYKNKFQNRGEKFDRYSRNWLKTSNEKLKTRNALYGRIYNQDVEVRVVDDVSRQDDLGFRTTLWV